MITDETTDSLEDLIKQRIRDKAFDDVERKKRTMNGDELPAYKKEIVLEHEKSQMSLAQIYEQEYVKKQTVMIEMNSVVFIGFSHWIRIRKQRRKMNDTKRFVKLCKIFSLISMLCQTSDLHQNQ